MKISKSTLIEFLILVSLLGVAFLGNLPKIAFRADENMWINQSSHLEHFVTGNFRPFSEPKVYALTMPTIPEYVIGLSRRAGGYKPKDLVEIWDWRMNYRENNAAGHVPNQGLLWWSRLLPVLLSIAAIAITFYLVKRAFNARAGYLWIALTLLNPWLIPTLQRAMGEPPLLFCITIAMLASFMALQSFDSQAIRKSIFWIAILGLFTGLAGQTKTNGLAMFAPGAIILVLLTIRCAAVVRWRFFTIGLVTLCLSSFVAFVGTNPFLWSDPIGRTVQTFQYRVEIMNGMQADAFPKRVIHNINEAIQIFITFTFNTLTTLPFPYAEYLQMLLAGVGLFIVTSKAWATVLGKTVSYAALSIFLTGLFLSIPSFFTTLSIERYYLFPVYFASILVVVGVEWLLHKLWTVSQTRTRSQQSTPNPEA